MINVQLRNVRKLSIGPATEIPVTKRTIMLVLVEKLRNWTKDSLKKLKDENVKTLAFRILVMNWNN